MTMMSKYANFHVDIPSRYFMIIPTTNNEL